MRVKQQLCCWEPLGSQDEGRAPVELQGFGPNSPMFQPHRTSALPRGISSPFQESLLTSSGISSCRRSLLSGPSMDAQPQGFYLWVGVFIWLATPCPLKNPQLAVSVHNCAATLLCSFSVFKHEVYVTSVSWQMRADEIIKQNRGPWAPETSNRGLRA